jgi:hypothetical protein
MARLCHAGIFVERRGFFFYLSGVTAFPGQASV